MNTRMAKSIVSFLLVAGLLVSTGFAATVRTSGSVTPAAVAPGAMVFIHSAVENLAITNQAVTVALTVNNPGGCVSSIAPHAGAFAFNLKPHETRIAALSLTVPPSACSGTYSVTITVTNAAGTVLATHTATFTVKIPIS
jgi:hypothetical protein